MPDVARAPVALVTGASRGIGKAIAVHLSRAGLDVAIGARTMNEGETRERSSTIHHSDERELPGSLQSTASLVEAAGRRAFPVYIDLLDRTSLRAAVDSVIEHWGRIDILVNNGRYVGPGLQDLFMDTPVELYERQLEANVLAPIVLSQLVLPGMLERGAGRIINIASTAGNIDPKELPGEGGWGLGYGMSKAALHRVAGVLARELGSSGIVAYNLHPGFVATERIAMEMAERGADSSHGVPADVAAAAATWLATSSAAVDLNGSWVDARELCSRLGLLAGWP